MSILIEKLCEQQNSWLFNNEEFGELISCPYCNGTMKYHSDCREYRCIHCGKDIDDFECVPVDSDDAGRMLSYIIKLENDEIIAEITVAKPTFETYGEECVVEEENDVLTLVINTKTGDSYLIPLDVYVPDKLSYSKLLHNSSPAENYILSSSEFINDLSKIFYETLKRPIPNLAKSGNSDASLPLHIMCTINRFKFLTNEHIESIISHGCEMDTFDTLANIPVDTKPEHIFKFLATDGNEKLLHTKTFRKMFIANPMSITFLDTYLKCGFTSIDLFPRFTENNIAEGLSMAQAFEFIHEIVDYKGEAETLKFLSNIKANHYTSYKKRIDEVYQMYLYLESRNLFHKEYLSGNFQAVHDRLAKLHNAASIVNYKFIYLQDQIDLFERTIDDIQFILPKNSGFLVMAGSELHNCVGTYGNAILAGTSTIVLMRRDDELVGCLEINEKKGNLLVQAKGPCNELLDVHEFEVLRKYIAECKINPSMCSDFTEW